MILEEAHEHGIRFHTVSDTGSASDGFVSLTVH
jgi:hypothetical protein